jgi:amino acid adenylation domain-containing protein
MSNHEELSNRIKALSPERKALFEKMRRNLPAQTAATPGLTGAVNPANPGNNFPLSFAQERLWFLHRLAPDRADYNLHTVLRLKGPLNVAALEYSLNEIIKRHAVLRAGFRDKGGVPYTFVLPQLEMALPVTDLTAQAGISPESQVQAHANEETRRPFDLANPPLIRVRLFRFTENDHFLLLTAHHIIFDGWSMTLFNQELAAAYTRFEGNPTGPLADLAVQYTDYAAWERTHLTGEKLEKLQTYWRQKLEPLPSRLELPPDHPRQTPQPFDSRVARFEFSAELTATITRFGRAEGLTPFIILLAAFKALLHFNSGQGDISVGSVVANRNLLELRPLIGFFANTLVLRTGLAGNPTFRELLNRVRQTALEAFDHQEFPFARLVEMLKPSREDGETPFIRTAFTFQSVPLRAPALPSLEVTLLGADYIPVALDFSLIMQEEEAKFSGFVSYNRSLFEPASIEKLLTGFQKILETGLARPDLHLNELVQESALEIPASKELKPPEPLDFYATSNLSANQLLIWLGQKLQPDLPIYNEIMVWDIQGSLEVETFRQAFRLTVQTHDNLRTVIRTEKAIPRQTNKPAASTDFDMEFWDLTAAPNPAAALEKIIAPKRRQIFDFEQVLFNSTLLKLASDHFVWALCMHQIITDGWTFSLIFKQTTESYDRLQQTQTPALSGLQAPPYLDFVEAERQYRQSAQFDPDKLYWKQKLAFPADRVSFYSEVNPKPTRQIERIAFDLGAERTAALKALTKQKGFSAFTQDMALFNLFSTILFAYLYRISGKTNLAIGAPFHNRTTPQLKGIGGLVMAVSPLRIKLAETETFLTLSAKVQTETRETVQHSRYITANSPRHPAYEVLLNYQTVKFGKWGDRDLEGRMESSGFEANTLAVQVHNFLKNGHLGIYFDFNTTVFNPEQQSRAIGHFVRIIDALLQNPGAVIGEVAILSPAEEATARFDFNPPGEVKPFKPVHHLFEEQVIRAPDAIAASLYDREISYRELDRQANRIARYLQDLGVKPDTPVGLCLERSPEMLAGLLGILKAGGAYLPLDPAYPPARLNFMLEDSGTALLLTGAALLEKFSGFEGKLVNLDEVGATLAPDGEADLPPPCPATRQNLAYVIYTSGSTGSPKGVMVEHASLANYIEAASQIFELGDADRVLQFAALSFDTAAEEIFPCLAAGGRLVLRTPDMLETPPAFFRKIHRRGVTVLDLPTAYWHSLVAGLEEVDPAHFENLRLVIIGGEKATPGALAKWQQRVSKRVRLLNTYGPTESTIVATVCELDRPEPTQVPIGRPIPNTWAYILNSHLQPMPPGAPGELYLGGVGLARGYLNRPGLTAERFRPNPFASQPPGQDRLYRTGDLARWRPDGNLEYLGRHDRQVKSRGFRIEPGEIEAALVAHPAIREAVVTVLEVSAGALTGYLVAQSGSAPGIAELRRFLAERLPAYMVPTHFVYLTEWPLTPSGKLDYGALPPPQPEMPGVDGADRVEPRTPEEKIIAGIWASLPGMGQNQAGIYDNFFALGGHSLLGTQLVSHINNYFGTEIPLLRLFETPTIAGLAQAVPQYRSAGSSQENITPVDRPGNKFPLSHSQLRLWFLDQLEPGNPTYNVPIAVRLRETVNHEALVASLNEIIRRHEILRTFFVEEDGQPFQVVVPGLTLAVPFTDLQNPGEAEPQAIIADLIQQEARQPFDLKQVPLLRAQLLKSGQADYIFLLTMHHIITDGWSLGLFLNELTALYEGFCEARPVQLPELPVQYADFAAWQKNRLSGPVLERQLAYWKKQLAGAPPLLQLPLDHPRGPVERFRGATYKFTFPSGLSQRLHTFSRQHDATLFMTLLAAFQTLLFGYSGQADFVIGSPVAGRGKVETENLLGLFVNTLVLRADCSGNPAFSELVERVRQTALAAFANQDAPFEKVVEALQPARSLSYSPVFQVMFTFFNEPTRRFLKLEEYNWLDLGVDRGMSNRDLTLRSEDGASGLVNYFEYNTDIFEEETIRQMAARLEILLNEIASNPGVRLLELKALILPAQRVKPASAGGVETRRLKFMEALLNRPRPVAVAGERLVKIAPMPGPDGLPLVVQPAFNDISLINWASQNREFIQENLHRYGAILFRGFYIEGVKGFEQLAQAVTPNLADYEERSTPRHSVEGKIYTSTEYPSDQTIMLHNEMSYAQRWPLKIWFYCLQPARRGGETPLVDSRRVYRELDSALRETFERKGVLYVRNYGQGLDLPWQEVFQTATQAGVEDYCRRFKIEFEWLGENRLRTRQPGPAVASHPQTGEKVWFNSAHMFHPAGLDRSVRDSINALFKEAELPRNVYYGDGSPIEASAIEHIREVYRRCAISFPWQKDDLVLADNMLVGHGRASFEGERRVLVAMAEMYSLPQAGEVN